LSLSRLTGLLFFPICRYLYQEEVVNIGMALEAETADKEHLFDLRMKIIKGIDPFRSNTAEPQLNHLEHNRKTMEKYLEKTPV
jgi:RNA polymerase sigma-70 factor (ECF subfamily)